MRKITPFLWFDNNAEDAINFYTKLFPDSEIMTLQKYPDDMPSPAEGPDLSPLAGKVMHGEFSLLGQEFKAMDAGPEFKFTPAISFMVCVKTEAEVDRLWEKLSDGGKVLMPLDKYDFSDKYGWANDKYGVSWQIILDESKETLFPSLLFVGDQAGRAEEAMKFYVSIFPDSRVGEIARYPEGGVDKAGTVMYGELILAGQTFSAMDSAQDHKFNFSEAVSLFVDCEDQAEVDKYWEALTANGGMEQPCGWLKDKFGVSWQIVPRKLGELLGDPDPEKANRVMQEMFKMKKIVVADLENAYNEN